MVDESCAAISRAHTAASSRPLAQLYEEYHVSTGGSVLIYGLTQGIGQASTTSPLFASLFCRMLASQGTTVRVYAVTVAKLSDGLEGGVGSLWEFLLSPRYTLSPCSLLASVLFLVSVRPWPLVGHCVFPVCSCILPR